MFNLYYNGLLVLDPYLLANTVPGLQSKKLQNSLCCEHTITPSFFFENIYIEIKMSKASCIILIFENVNFTTWYLDK
jgi:hypothetical protein